MTSSGEVSPASITPSGTPSSIGSHAPKFGITIRNRIFVGGIPAGTTDQELKAFFSSKGAVKDVKIVTDRAGVSKGYGFVTFETQEDADKILKETENVVFKDRKLNLGVAIRKTQPAMSMIYGGGGMPGTILLPNGVSYTYQNGMAFFQMPDSSYQVAAQTQSAYPMVVPTAQPLYMSQPGYSYPTAGVTAPLGSQYSVYPMQTITPEMLYAQPAAQAYAATELDASYHPEGATAEFPYGAQYASAALHN